MQFSEYPIELRKSVVAEGIKRFESMMRRRDGNNVLDRNQERSKRATKGHQWYANGRCYESVMFVEATPKSELKKEVEKVVRRLQMKIKVVERVGITIKSLLQRSNPFGVKDCNRDKCLLCCQGSNSDCRTRGCVYEYECLQCIRIYRGQTGRSMYERGKEHLEAWEAADDECPLQRHANIYHEGGHFEAEVKIIARCYGKPSRRLITEAVMIDEIPPDKTMNSKSEWSYVKLAKVQVPGEAQVNI